ncbi:P1 family peptidase [Meiothermus sp. CFH 77666]|uniref:P1 family peptidase n=1 Tax=Meiothermus sp. CFH 77666 TaxID=2817942 RepID=UPI001AA01781|nr:P1 family peptidase [Meiothermus sp. CFH 77666]MBO1436770.1 P1 family peptidase [Meiothermus sp. CFH 77666]
MKPGPYNAITDVPGIQVGHFTDLEHLTGVTVILPEKGAVAGVDVRGSAPGTRETDLLNPVNLVEKVQAVVLAGGSAYGLEAATGVMRWLEERRQGYPVGNETTQAIVPIVPAAVIFDLLVGSALVRPSAEYGYRAAQNLRGGLVEQGVVGVGTGARNGGLKGGVGTASLAMPGGVMVGALVAANAHGRAHDPVTGEIYARFLEQNGEFKLKHPPKPLSAPDYTDLFANPFSTSNTVIGCVATNARLTKAQAQKIAQMAHDGIARAVFPAHTMFDGDVIFCLATGEVEIEGPAELSRIGAVAADVFARALVHGVLHAYSVGGLRAYRELYEEG